MLKIENGTPQNSFSNIIHCCVQHGPIVGVIHRIHPNNTHSTFVFFFNEYVHEATGFSCGEKDNINCEFLKALIGMIPGCVRNIEGDIINIIGSKIDPVYIKAQQNKVTIHYIFKPNMVIGDFVINSLGYKVFEMYCSEIYTEDKGAMMEVERP